MLALDAALALVVAPATGRVLAGVASAKFLRPILPEQEVTVSCGAVENGRIGFQCVVDGAVVLRGTALLR